MAMAEMRFISSDAVDKLDGRILQVNRSTAAALYSFWFSLNGLSTGSIRPDGLPSRSQ